MRDFRGESEDEIPGETADRMRITRGPEWTFGTVGAPDLIETLYSSMQIIELDDGGEHGWVQG